ncbi:MAG: DUF554 domain-containing protein [Syntrophales bacterium]
MTGTLANSGAILIGSLIGIFAGKRVPERIKRILMQALGLSVIVIGIQMAVTGSNMVVLVGCLLFGALTGEIIDIERKLERIGSWLKTRFRSDSSSFVQGFVSASILYLTGAMVIVGSIQDGTAGDPRILYVKSLLDGVASVALASSLGAGVALSAVSVLVVQGSITLLASQLLFLQRPNILDAITATGGVLIVGIGINILEIRQIRVGNFVPAILYAVIWEALRT